MEESVNTEETPTMGFPQRVIGIFFFKGRESAQVPEVLEWLAQGSHRRAGQRVLARFLCADAVAFGQVFDFNGGDGIHSFQSLQTISITWILRSASSIDIHDLSKE